MKVIFNGIKYIIGEFVFDRRLLLFKYLRNHLPIDILNTIPYSLLKYNSTESREDDLMNFVTLNLAHLPKAYILMLGIKLIRIRKAKASLHRFLKWCGVGVDFTSILITLWSVIIILHLIACFWGSTATFN